MSCPVKPESVKPEPAKPEPVKPEPVKPEVRHRMRALHSMVLGWGTVALVYFCTGWLDAEPVIIPQVWLDQQLGFTVNAVWFYLSFFVLIPYTYFSVDPGHLRPLRYAMQISAVVSGLFFVFLPSSLSYPQITQQGISADTLKLLIAVDSPNNCFPSLHASLTSICVIAGLQKRQFWRSVAFVITGFSILISIIMLRRHISIDVGGGVLVGVASYYLAKCFVSARFAANTNR